MTPGRPGDGSYRDPYGQDSSGQEPRHGQDAYGQDAYGQDAYGQDPYGVRGGGAHRGDAYREGGYGNGQSHGGQQYGDESYGQSAWDPDPYAYPYEQPRGEYRAAVDALADPLTDPLPSSDAPESGLRVPSWAPDVRDDAAATPEAGQREEQTSSWFRPAREQGGTPGAGQQAAVPQPPQGGHPQQGAAARQGHPGPRQQASHRPVARRGPADLGETAAMPAVEPPVEAAVPRRRRAAHGAGPVTGAADSTDTAASATNRTGAEDDEHRTVALRRPSEEELGGRAARRRAAAAGRGKGRGRRAGGAEPAAPPRPMTRLEARRAARAAKDGPVVLLSRAIGEVFITCGVLMLLFVAYQLWWTNVLADNYAGGAKDSLTEKWEENPERKPGRFSPGQGFAIMYIPKLDVVVPVAEGIDKPSVLDNGLVGHYDEASGVPTAMPWDKQGNFGVAGHRNTHGEPFRYVNRLIAGDKIIIETAEKYYIYEMYSRLPSTKPSNVSVLDPVPPQSGFDKPGRYITLTTCTPEFTSKYRLIVWGRMVDERPRSEGKPDALIE